MLTRTIGLSVIILATGIAVSAQCPVMPSGFLCITQEAGNVAAQNAKENVALKAKVVALEDGLKQKDVTIAELKDTNQKNVKDLTDQLSKVTAEAAYEKGRVEQCHEDKVLWSAIIPVLIQNTRQKTNGIKVF